jgi:DNA-binding IclR family transcriptional regulator
MRRSAQLRSIPDRPARSVAGPPGGADSAAPNGVVDKVASLLIALAGEKKALDLSEIAAHTRINKSTACRILKRLAVHRLVDQDPNSGCYKLGLALFELGRRVADTERLCEVARPVLEALARESGETAHFAILDVSEGRVVHLERVESSHPVRAIPSQTGKGYPFHCLSVGKAIAAFLPEAERRLLLSRSKFARFTPRTITRRDDLEHELEKIRRLGYAVDDEEYYEGIRCVAVPVLGQADTVLGGLSVAGPANRVTLDRVERLAARLGRAATEVATELSPSLGYTGLTRGQGHR